MGHKVNLVKSINIGERLKQLREKQSLTVNEFAKKAGIPSSTYKEWEQGRQIRGEPYAQLAAVCQISVQELITVLFLSDCVRVISERLCHTG